MAPALERLSACFGADISADSSALLAPVRQLPCVAVCMHQTDSVVLRVLFVSSFNSHMAVIASMSSSALQGASSEYDAATATVSAARQVLDGAADGERAAFVFAGADSKLAKRICVEDTEEGVVLRVRTPTETASTNGSPMG